MSQTDPRVGTGTAARPRPAVAAAVTLLVLVLVVLGAAATGPWQRDPMGGGTASYVGTASSTAPLPTPTGSSSLPPEEQSDPSGTNSVLRWVMYGLALAVAVLLLLLVLRFVAAVMRRRADAGEDARTIQPATDVPDIDAPAMQEGIARAQRILDSDRPPRDAIVEAWVALERAATESGVGRRPAQTPTEFTAVVLRRTPAQRDSVDLLRDLYERVRFSDSEVSAADATAAREALTQIADSWSAVSTDG